MIDNPEAFVAVVGLVFTVVSVFHSLLMGWIQRRIARRERTAELYDDFYSADTYRRVVAPVMRLTLKWDGLPPEEARKYRDVVRMGWQGFRSDPAQAMRAYVSEEWIKADPARAHFRDTLSTEMFTEHEALTVFLYFWTRLWELVDANLLCRQVARKLFREPYCYYRHFLAELRADVVAHSTAKDVQPPWVHATEKLDAFFA